MARRPVYPEPRTVFSTSQSEARPAADRPSTFLRLICFQQLTTVKLCNSSVLITIQNAGGGGSPSHCFANVLASLPFYFQSVAGCSSRNAFLFRLLHCCRGGWGSPSVGVKVLLEVTIRRRMVILSAAKALSVSARSVSSALRKPRSLTAVFPSRHLCHFLSQ